MAIFTYLCKTSPFNRTQSQKYSCIYPQTMSGVMDNIVVPVAATGDADDLGIIDDDGSKFSDEDG